MDRYDVKNRTFNASRNGSNAAAYAQKMEEWASRQDTRGPAQGKKPVMPIDPSVRPEHPTLGGPLYLIGVPAALDDEDFEIVKAYYDRAFENLPGDVTTARLKLAAARRGARSVYEAYQSQKESEKAQAEAVRAARAIFGKLVFDLQKLMCEATTEPTGRLRDLETKLTHEEEEIRDAMMAPGVPMVAVRRVLEMNVAKATVTLPQPNAALASATPQPAESAKVTASSPAASTDPLDRGTRSDWKESLYLIASVPGGMLIGQCLGLELTHLEKLKMLRFEYLTNYWQFFFDAVGTGAIYLFSKGIGRVWEIAAEAAETEPPTKGAFLNWRRLRHTLFPFVVTGIVAAVEASIIRNEIVLNPTILDQGNPAYFLGALPVILPAALAAATLGWMKGRKVGRAAAADEKERNSSEATQTRASVNAATEVVEKNAEAQPALAHAWYADILREKIAAVQAEIAVLLAPYLDLLAIYREEIVMAAPDPQLRAELGRGFEEAVASNNAFLREHVRLARRTDGSFEEVTTINNIVIKSDTAPAPPARKPTRWQRLKAFVGRLFGRRPAAPGG